MIQTDIGKGAWLDGPAAAAFARAVAAGAPFAVESAGRSWVSQAYLWARYGRPRAVPPGESFHVKGQAIDANPPLRTWFNAHPEFGWIKTTWEPWHYQYMPERDQHRNPVPVTNTAATPATLNIEGGTMRAVATRSGRRFVLGELTYQDMTDHWDHASHEAHIWNPDTAGEPQVIEDATLDLAVGQIQKRRAQLADALKFHGV